MSAMRICKFCGKAFLPTNPNAKYCDRTHTAICKICGKEFVIPNARLGNKLPKTCSRKCSAVLRKLTYRQRTGYDSPAQNPEVLKKMEHTTKLRYGVEHPMQNDDVKNRAKATNIKKYGKEWYTQTEEYTERVRLTSEDKYGAQWPTQADEIKSKTAATNIKRYGHANPMQNEDIQSKVRNSNQESTGYEYPLQNPESLKKMENTNLEKYGTKYPMQNLDIKAAMQNTMFEKYGTYNADNQKTFVTSNMADASRGKYLREFHENPRGYIKKYFDCPPSTFELAKHLGILHTSVGVLIHRYGCEDLIRYKISHMEFEVSMFLREICPEIKILHGVRNIISPYELDLYLPDYKIAIECNPTVTHNSSVPFLDSDSPIPPGYHKMKSDMCREKGIFLFHIFGYEWTYKKDIILSMLRNLIGKSERSIYARNTYVDELNYDDCKSFLDCNHRQGATSDPIRYGLYTKDTKELVSVMTFGKVRNIIGKSKNDNIDDNYYELVRFCNRLNTSVVGGASKLFKYFLKQYHPTEVRSFSDCAHTRGNLYEALGFKKSHLSKPGYVWVDSISDIAYSRINAQKQNIKRFLHDDSIDLSMTEREIMEQHGYVRVYDSGTILWKYSNIYYQRYCKR